MSPRRIACAVVPALLTGVASAQDAPPKDQNQREAFRALLQRADELEPARRLGMRSALNTSLHAAIPDVVIVPDEPSYLAAIGAWRPDRFFPVLIDNGSDAAREDIARFVRAYRPRAIVRWSGDERLPPPGPERRREFERVLAGAWTLEGPSTTQAALIDAWVSLDIRPAGIIVADESDNAWTAALALAAGRAQPIAWIPVDGHVGATMSRAQVASLEARLRAECTVTGLAWDALGDDIDAVTVCQNAPSKVDAGADTLALTDVLARADDGQRWAWTSQIFGNGPHAAYMAMSALFLEPRSAWLFDGYADEGAYAQWDATAAGVPLRERGMDVTVIDLPNGDLATWRDAAAHPLDADLVLVNTQGNRTYFDLHPGRAFAGDVPVLEHPAFVHFVHSWSAANAANRATVAGRWLERGAAGYYGSVEEPFLQAFVPTPIVAGRLVSGYPWGAAVRLDSGPPWKLATFGDPLHVGTAPKRIDAPLPLAGAEAVEAHMRAAVGAQRFTDAVVDLVLLGRDDDAARLAIAVLNEHARLTTPEMIIAALPAAFRAGRTDDLFRLYQLLPGHLTGNPALRDLLWLAATPRLDAPDPQLIALLRDNIRQDQVPEDAIRLAEAARRAQGVETALAILNTARAQATITRDRRTIDEAIRDLGGR